MPRNHLLPLGSPPNSTNATRKNSTLLMTLAEYDELRGLAQS
jgi:hypothetical protein